MFFLFTFFPTDTSSQTKESKVYDVADQLMCPVCRGQTVADSNSDLARDMRNVIKKMLEEGKSEEEIVNYFSQRYGNSILASPPVRGVNIVLWFLPLTGITIGFIFLALYLRNESKRKSPASYNQGKDKIADPDIIEEIEEEIRSDDQ